MTALPQWFGASAPYFVRYSLSASRANLPTSGETVETRLKSLSFSSFGRSLPRVGSSRMPERITPFVRLSSMLSKPPVELGPLGDGDGDGDGAGAGFGAADEGVGV